MLVDYQLDVAILSAVGAKGCERIAEGRPQLEKVSYILLHRFEYSW